MRKWLVLLLGVLLVGCTTNTPVVEEASLPEGVYLDNEYARIEIGDLNEKANYYGELRISITNKTDKVLIAGPEDITVNGFSLQSFGSASILPNNTYEVHCYVGTGMLSLAGYERLEEAGLTYDLYDVNDQETPVAVSERYIYSTGNMKEMELSEDKEALIESDKLDLYVIGVDDGSAILATDPLPMVYYYAENKSDEPITVLVDDLSGNDGTLTINKQSAERIPAHSKKLCGISFGDEYPYEVYKDLSFNVTVGDKTVHYETEIK